MESIAADIRQSFRMMRKSPSFTVIAIAALALGIGANTAIFSVVNAVLLQPLPYPEPDRIVKIGRQFRDGVGYSNSIPKYMAWRHNQALEAMTAYDFSGPGLNLGSGDKPEQIKGIHVSADYFKVFGVMPSIGRIFTQIEDLPSGPKVAILSDQLWKSHFAGDVQQVGKTTLLNKEPVTIIGIMPKDFRSDPPADIWIPLQADPNSNNQGHFLSVAGRLKPGATAAAGQAELKVIAAQFRKTHPDIMSPDESVAVVTMRDAMVKDVKKALFVLLGAVAFVLLIACSNVANLLLARSASRQRELAIRAAIGASRWRVIRQLLTESIFLAGLGGILGFILGLWGVHSLLLLIPDTLPRMAGANGKIPFFALLDWRIALFTIVLCGITGILFGLFPALQISNPDLASTLKEASGRSATGLRQNRTRSLLVVTEVALALVLLTGAGLLIRTFVGLRSVNSGVNAQNVLTFNTSFAGTNYATTAKVDNLVTPALRRIEALPGVEIAASAIVLPFEIGMDLPFLIAGHAPPKGDPYNGDEQWRSVTAHYFKTLKIPLLRGRTFDEHDTQNSQTIVIINDAMAKKYFPKENPVGQVLTIGKGLGPEFEDKPREIVGVVGNVRETGLSNALVPVLYVPQSQVPDPMTALGNTIIPIAWLVRTTVNPISLKAAIEQEIRAVDGQMPLSKVRTMEQVIAESTARENFNMLLLTIFAGMALLLAAIGIYGLMSYSVEQRTQELGIRMALGAAKGDMVKLVVWQGMKLALIGVAAGIATAFGLTRLLASFLFDVKAYDPFTFTVVAVTLTGIAFLATYIPARRAMRVDPVIALRYE